MTDASFHDIAPLLLGAAIVWAGLEGLVVLGRLIGGGV